MITRRLSFVALAILVVATSVQAATFTIRSTDGAGEGLNDPTPFTPVGGNTATTLGAARMQLLNEAARIWGLLLQSNVTIQVDVSFDALTCSSSSGTLGSAGARTAYRLFPGAPSPNIYYVSALADALSGTNLSSNATAADIIAEFNSSVDSDATCLRGAGFYYGFDHNRGTKIDLLLVVLHELGHGLGFASQVDTATGIAIVGGDGVERFDSYTQFVFDETVNLAWPAMTATQRVQSSTNAGRLAWNGAAVNGQANRYTLGVTANGRLRLYAVTGGSEVSHFDSAVFPNVLMEPFLPSTINTSSTDITVCALRDIGWTTTQCPHFATNRAPNAVEQSLSTAEDTSLSILLTGNDADGDVLTFSIAASPTKGTLSTISPSREIIYTPNANATGSDSFTYTVSDGVLTSAAATISINITPVNDAPTATSITSSTQTGQAVNITLTGSDPDGDAITYSVARNPTSGNLSGIAPNLSYQPNAGFSGSDSFSYTVSDGTLTSTGTVSITVLPPPAASSSGGGGGGTLALGWIFALVSLTIRGGLSKHLSSRRGQ